MTDELMVLSWTAASIGFLHTLFGPDHYIPFIFMAKARKWSMFKTSWITVACGIGHVGSSIVVGTIGVAFGIALGKLEAIEGTRGNGGMGICYLRPRLFSVAHDCVIDHIWN